MWNGYTFYSKMTVNMAETLWNEARGEPGTANVAVACGIDISLSGTNECPLIADERGVAMFHRGFSYFQVRVIAIPLLLASSIALSQDEAEQECRLTFDDLGCLRSQANSGNPRQQNFVHIAEVIRAHLDSERDTTLSQSDRGGLMREAFDAYVASANMSIQGRGFWRISRDIADLAYMLRDRDALDDVFRACIDRCVDIGDKYIALLDYADALARFQAPEADFYFHRATMETPANHDPYEAYMRYARYLDSAGRYSEAVELLDSLDPAIWQLHPDVARMRDRLTQKLDGDAIGRGRPVPRQDRANSDVGVRRYPP